MLKIVPTGRGVGTKKDTCICGFNLCFGWRVWVLKIVPAERGVGTKKDTSELARAMRDKGKSYRQIAEELGYKSPQSVINLINKE